MVNFLAMTKPEAETFLQRWLGEGPARLHWLRQAAETTNGPADLNGTGVSLGPLWAWARTGFAWRAAGEPIDPAALPAWFHDPSGVGFNRYSDHTLWLIDAIARYWAKALIAEDPAHRLQWAVGHSRKKGYADQNQPVIVGFTVPLNPIFVVGTAVNRSLDGEVGDDRLRELHDIWIGKLPAS